MEHQEAFRWNNKLSKGCTLRFSFLVATSAQAVLPLPVVPQQVLQHSSRRLTSTMAPKVAAPKAAAPKAGPLPKDANSGMALLAKRVEGALGKAIYKEAKQIDPRKILVSQSNRNGAPPNVQYVHRTILKSFLEKGFDYSRPPVGICGEVKSADAKRKLLVHNKKFLSPPCHPSSRRVFSTLPSRAATWTQRSGSS